MDPDSSAANAQAADAAELPVLIRQRAGNESTLQALFIGRLHLDANGCLRADSDAGPIIIWHHDTRIQRTPDGRTWVADPSMGNAVQVGEEIALSGGCRAGPATNVAGPVPHACQPQSRFFVAGRVMSGAQRQGLLERQRNRPTASSPPDAER